MSKRPEIVEDQHLGYLDELRKSGETNMWGATAYLMAVYPELTRDQAGEVLIYWIKTFGKEER